MGGGGPSLGRPEFEFKLCGLLLQKFLETCDVEVHHPLMEPDAPLDVRFFLGRFGSGHRFPPPQETV